jgi:hypothetical protein
MALWWAETRRRTDNFACKFEKILEFESKHRKLKDIDYGDSEILVILHENKSVRLSSPEKLKTLLLYLL